MGRTVVGEVYISFKSSTPSTVLAADYCQNGPCPWRSNKKIPLNYLIIPFLSFQHVHRHECWMYESLKNKPSSLKTWLQRTMYKRVLKRAVSLLQPKKKSQTGCESRNPLNVQQTHRSKQINYRSI